MSEDTVLCSGLVCLADLETEGKKCMSKKTVSFFEGGADKEFTLKDNIDAFRR
jgi:hypothetical protein